LSYPTYQVPAGDVLPVMFNTYAGSTGASVTLTGLAVTDIEIYKDGSVTQRASDAGYTLLDTDGIDFDGITGIHGFSIDTGDNTDAGFYTVGAWFTVVVSAVTVDSQTVNFIACQFRLMAAESIAAKPKVDVDAWLGTAAATPTVAGVPEVDLTHVAGATTNVAALATNVDAILTDTGTTLDARIPAALVGGRMDASVGAMAANVMTAAAAAADLTTELQSGLATAAALDTVDNFLDTEVAAIKAVTDKLDTTLVLDGAVYDFTAAALAAAPSGGLDAAGVRSAIGMAAANMDTQLGTLATQTSVNTIDDFLDTEIAAIKAKTDSLTFTQTGHVDANVQRINDVTITGDGSTTPFDVV
jgi:hypothetical protein